MQKNEQATRLREALFATPGIVETDRADPGFSTLSSQSRTFENRHVWVDTDLNGRLIVDLEDWLNDEKWDNAVVHLLFEDLKTAEAVIVKWLLGESLNDCKSAGGTEIEMF